jgi:hypothetical protein
MACSASARLTASLALRSSEVSALGCRFEICSMQRTNAERAAKLPQLGKTRMERIRVQAIGVILEHFVRLRPWFQRARGSLLCSVQNSGAGAASWRRPLRRPHYSFRPARGKSTPTLGCLQIGFLRGLIPRAARKNWKSGSPGQTGADGWLASLHEARQPLEFIQRFCP